MPQCEHYDICSRDGGEGTEEDLCVLHSKNPDKNRQTFDEALDPHQQKKADNFSFFVVPVKINFSEATFGGEADFRGASFSGTASVESGQERGLRSKRQLGLGCVRHAWVPLLKPSA